MNITLYVEVEWYLCAHLFLYLVQAQGSRDGEHLDAGLYLSNFISNEQYEVKLIRQVANKVFLENETWKKQGYMISFQRIYPSVHHLWYLLPFAGLWSGGVCQLFDDRHIVLL